ncbi:hypothetical protein MP638_004611 [Amoeboaphelidium occidentale]|nr:hypothetical protein MP638_004611 [Amoeboaphelidium occidentale]
MNRITASVKAVSRSAIPRPPVKAPITITPSAVSRLNYLYKKTLEQSNTTSTSSIAQSNPTKYLKVAVRTKGCSGNAYALDWVDQKGKLDEEVKINDTLKLLIDSKALFTLLGSQMDYVEEKLSSGFVFNNPNVKETCGCGMSFIV